MFEEDLSSCESGAADLFDRYSSAEEIYLQIFEKRFISTYRYSML